jgi:hypothetical protein
MMSLPLKVDKSYSILINLVRERGKMPIHNISKLLKISIEKTEMLVFRGVNESYLHKYLEDNILMIYPKRLV